MKIFSLFIVVGLLCLSLRLGTGHADTARNAVRSGASGQCLDVYHSQVVNGSSVDTAGCNGSIAQTWQVTSTNLVYRQSDCATALSSGRIVIETCRGAANQVWLREQNGLYNPLYNQCLATSTTTSGQLTLANCQLGTVTQTWTPGSGSITTGCGDTEGARVACAAITDWRAWQAAGSNHNALLTVYTDGTPYEAWCADFVSYVYKQAGYAFTAGGADGWDENSASQIQNMGFTLHMAGSGYVPRAGDVAYFNYPGGHVEIVVSGGTQPTFVYGDSATIDPSTGNGQMKANTKTADGEMGSVQYYLSPDQT